MNQVEIFSQNKVSANRMRLDIFVKLNLNRDFFQFVENNFCDINFASRNA